METSNMICKALDLVVPIEMVVVTLSPSCCKDRRVTTVLPAAVKSMTCWVILEISMA